MILYGLNSFRILHKIVPHLGLPLIKLVSNQQNFFCQARGNFKKKPSRVMTVMHHAFLNVNSFVCNVDERCQVFFSIYDAREGRFIRCVRISLVLLFAGDVKAD